uniref:Uncharacterized protein n=1 Tax=Rangifer tarandus platyrhynchus TaxID=3082113 RepID=A0ACB0FBL3_RANTA|nr:unnamed protein product [Rangifer tarandus platyrhynchus]
MVSGAQPSGLRAQEAAARDGSGGGTLGTREPPPASSAQLTSGVQPSTQAPFPDHLPDPQPCGPRLCLHRRSIRLGPPHSCPAPAPGAGTADGSAVPKAVSSFGEKVRGRPGRPPGTGPRGGRRPAPRVTFSPSALRLLPAGARAERWAPLSPPRPLVVLPSRGPARLGGLHGGHDGCDCLQQALHAAGTAEHASHVSSTRAAPLPPKGRCLHASRDQRWSGTRPRSQSQGRAVSGHRRNPGAFRKLHYKVRGEELIRRGTGTVEGRRLGAQALSLLSSTAQTFSALQPQQGTRRWALDRSPLLRSGSLGVQKGSWPASASPASALGEVISFLQLLREKTSLQVGDR